MRIRTLVLSLFILYCSTIRLHGSSALDPGTSQGLEGGFWHTNDNFEPILRLKNVLLKQTLVVSPSLYFADGTEFRLPPQTLAPAGIAQVNIRYAIQNAPASIRSHISTFGMAAISYQWSWPAIVASIQATDEIASLTTVSSFQADVRQVHAPNEAATPQIVRGTWWLPTDNADYFIALGNSSHVSKVIQLVISGHDGKTLADTRVSLNKHAVQLLHLSDILGRLNPPDRLSGIEIRYSGAERSVVSYAGIIDASVGFSASPSLIEDRPLPVRPDHMATIGAPGIMLGRPDRAMLFPVSTLFSPYAILHNVSSHLLQVKLSLDTQGSTAASQTRTLNSVSLAPGEALQYEFASQFTKDNPLPDGYGAVSATFEGQDGDLRVQAGSIDQSQSYVFEVPASLQAETASRTLCFWSVEGDNDTMVAVWNYHTVPQDLVLTLHYVTGQYAIPIHLEGRQAYNLDLMSLVRSHMPDPSGALIPSNIDSGSAVLSSARGELDRISVSVATSIFNVRNATCGYGCVTCNGVVSVTYSTSPIRVNVTRTTSANIRLTMGSGTVVNNPSGTWHTSNTAIATVNSNGVHTGLSVGRATCSFLAVNVPVNATICGPAGSVTCPNTSWGATDPIDVTATPTVTVSSPGGIPYGQVPPEITANVSGSEGVPIGTLEFSIIPSNTTPPPPIPLDLSGNAVWNMANLGGGTLLPVAAYTVGGAYSGDDTYEAADGSGTFAIIKAGASVAISNCPTGTVAAGKPLSLTVNVGWLNAPTATNTPEPTGMVSLTATPTSGGSAISASGILSMQAPRVAAKTTIAITLKAGTYGVTAAYQGDADYDPEPSSVQCRVTAH